jgi:hypothetical protein
VEKVYVTGNFARGIDNSIIDLVFVGEEINKEFLLKLVGKTEELISRKIRYVLFNKSELELYLVNLKKTDFLLLWQSE